MKLKELNRELERIDELSLTSIKNKSNKFINPLPENPVLQGWDVEARNQIV